MSTVFLLTLHPLYHTDYGPSIQSHNWKMRPIPLIKKYMTFFFLILMKCDFLSLKKKLPLFLFHRKWNRTFFVYFLKFMVVISLYEQSLYTYSFWYFLILSNFISTLKKILFSLKKGKKKRGGSRHNGGSQQRTS